MNSTKNSNGASVALYRKYRPKTFADVLDQDGVVKVLEAAIKKDNIAHAYIFAGSRGTGKTSVARIFAREIGTTDDDVYEIDAASNNGVDEIRLIKEAVQTRPFSSKYKVYILDEAHMLSKSAWNALLKTLEEPPAYVIFILATTEMEKVPETVISRCQVFSFKKPTHETLKKVTINIARAEGFTLEKSAAELIAFLGDGSFRDAQVILQKVITAQSGKSISIENVETVSGAPKGKLLEDVLIGIEEKDSSKSLLAIEKAKEQNIDMKLFLRLLLERVRVVLLLRFAKEMEKKLSENYTEGDFKLLKDLANKKGGVINSKVLDELLCAYEEINFAAIKELPLQLALMRIMGDK
ncbi:MAG: DNA polymerase III subunit gamma/tau [Patescibacteria group bacterium]